MNHRSDTFENASSGTSAAPLVFGAANVPLMHCQLMSSDACSIAN